MIKLLSYTPFEGARTTYYVMKLVPEAAMCIDRYLSLYESYDSKEAEDFYNNYKEEV